MKLKNNVWYALPWEVADWWRRRDKSNIRFDSKGKPYIQGPASEDGVIASAELVNDRLAYVFNKE